MSAGFATQNSVARTGSSEVLRSKNPTPTNTIPLRIIKIQMVVAAFAPPIDAANDWISVPAGAITWTAFTPGIFSASLVSTPVTLACACGQETYARSEEHTSELQSLRHLVCRLLLE